MKILIIQPKMFSFVICVVPVTNSSKFFFNKNFFCYNLARALVRVKSSSPVKLSFTFWSLVGELFKCCQKYFNTVIYEGCSSRLLLFHVQTRRTNWVSVVRKLGSICNFLKRLNLVFSYGPDHSHVNSLSKFYCCVIMS